MKPPARNVPQLTRKQDNREKNRGKIRNQIVLFTAFLLQHISKKKEVRKHLRKLIKTRFYTKYEQVVL